MKTARTRFKDKQGEAEKMKGKEKIPCIELLHFSK
jgi:hypothetical protein